MAQVHKVQIFGQSPQSRSSFTSSFSSPSSSSSSTSSSISPFSSSTSAGTCDDMLFAGVLNPEDIDDDLTQYHAPNWNNYHHHSHHPHYQHQQYPPSQHHHANPHHRITYSTHHVLPNSHYHRSYDIHHPPSGFNFIINSPPHRHQMISLSHSPPCDRSSSSTILPIGENDFSHHEASFGMVASNNHGNIPVEPVANSNMIGSYDEGEDGEHFKISQETVNQQSTCSSPSSQSELQYVSTINNTTPITATNNNNIIANEPVNQSPCFSGSNVTSSDMKSENQSINLIDTPITDHSMNHLNQPPKKRNTANKKERKRTVSINTAFSLLRDHIPNVPIDTKLSKIKTLRLATDYINYLMTLLETSNSPDSYDKHGNPTRSFKCEDFKVDLQRFKGVRSETESKINSSLKDRSSSSSSLISPSNIDYDLINMKKAKGRTGWPQHVWALELKQQQST